LAEKAQGREEFFEKIDLASRHKKFGRWNETFKRWSWRNVSAEMNHDRRRELYDRFLKSGITGFLDHESVELLLSALFPTEDVDRIARALKAKLGGLRGILDAPLSELESVDGVGRIGAISLRIVRETAALYLQETA
jgi:DNA repair protein RadC